MVSKFRLCRAIQSARASASATVPIASTSTASYSPKIKVDVIGSKPSGSPKGFGRSPTMTLPGAVKTFTLSVLDVMGAVMCLVSLGSYAGPCASTRHSEERSDEESLFLLAFKQGEIPRFARSDDPKQFFKKVLTRLPVQGLVRLSGVVSLAPMGQHSADIGKRLNPDAIQAER